MTLAELELALVNCKVPKDAYSLSSGLPNETYCLEKAGAEWCVYYSERGLRTGIKSFTSEQEACDYFLRWVTSEAFER